jgi:hypothetical protein
MYDLWLFDLLSLSSLSSGPGFDLWRKAKVASPEAWFRWTQNETYTVTHESEYDFAEDGSRRM